MAQVAHREPQDRRDDESAERSESSYPTRGSPDGLRHDLRHDLEHRRVAHAHAARIAQLRREYIEGTPPASASTGAADTPPATSNIDDEPRIQMRLPLT